MSSNEANGTAVIQDGVEYKIELGESFLDPEGHNYYSLQFSFIPESVDFSKQGVLRRNNQRNINLQYQTTQGEPKYFDGTYDDTAKNECFLIFDGHTLRMEQISCSTATALKPSQSATIAPSSSTAQGTLVQPNNVYTNSAANSPNAGAQPVTPDSTAKKPGGVRIKLRVPGHGADGKNPITPPGGQEPTTPQPVQTPPGTVNSQSSVSPPDASTTNKKKESAAGKGKGPRGGKAKAPSSAQPKRAGKTIIAYGRKKKDEDAELADYAKELEGDLLGDLLGDDSNLGSSDNDAHVDNNHNGNNEDHDVSAQDIMSFDYIPPPEPSSSANHVGESQGADPMDLSIADPLEFNSQPVNATTTVETTDHMMNDDDSSDSDSDSDSSDSSDSDS